MVDTNEQTIIEFLKANDGVSSKEVHEAIASSASYSTVKGVLGKLVLQNFIITQGQKIHKVLYIKDLRGYFVRRFG